MNRFYNDPLVGSGCVALVVASGLGFVLNFFIPPLYTIIASLLIFVAIFWFLFNQKEP